MTTRGTPQIRHWCFTSFRDAWPNWIPDKMLYLVYQVEVSPTTGAFHIQGYVEFARSVRLNSAKKLLGDPAAHLEPRQGSRDQARAYCMKEDSRADHEQAGPWEFGEWSSGAEKRSELQLAVESIKSGVSWENTVSEFTSLAVRHYKNLHAVWNHFNCKPRDGTQPVYNLYLYGDAGVGKTRFAYWLCARDSTVPYTSYCPGWWQDYVGQAWALYDDFDGSAHMDVSHFKKICDRYPVTVPIKGGSAEYRATVNIFTSNTLPIEWYRREHWDAVKRRAYHCIWWRSSSIHCDTCNSDSAESCSAIQLIEEARAEWAVEDL